MSPLSSLRRRAPWVAGAVLLALIGLPLLLAGLRFGLRYWPWLLGAGAALLLLAGSLERWWQSRPVSSRQSRTAARSRGRFRVVDGGLSGSERPTGPAEGDEEDPDKPTWLM